MATCFEIFMRIPNWAFSGINLYMAYSKVIKVIQHFEAHFASEICWKQLEPAGSSLGEVQPGHRRGGINGPMEVDGW